MRPFPLIAVLLVLTASAPSAFAQTGRSGGARTTQVVEGPAGTGWDIEPFLGVARHSPVGYDWGIVADRSHVFLGVDLRAPVLTLGRVRAYYAPSLTPLLRLSHEPREGSIEPQRPTALGAGAAPFGVGVGIAITPRLELFGASRVGFILFDREVPVPDARAFNVSLEWGGELRWRTLGGHSLTLGYKFHHLSNVYTAPENPGVDADVVELGYGWHWSGPRGS